MLRRMDNQFSAIERMLKDFSGRMKSRPLWTGFVILVMIFLIVAGGFLYKTGQNYAPTPETGVPPTAAAPATVFAPHTMNNSPAGLQVQAGQININAFAAYTWANQSSWFPQPQDTKYVTSLQFRTSEGALPSKMCFIVRSDQDILEIFTSGVVDFFTNKGKLCVSPANREHIVEITTQNRPSTIRVDFFQP